jgi:uncharacterized protein
MTLGGPVCKDGAFRVLGQDLIGWLMPSITISREMNLESGRYVGRIDGFEGKAELTFVRISATQIDADHTFAPDTMRGTGIAKALVERLVADARAEGLTIVPTCSYIQAQFARHPDWSDVRANVG